MQNHTSEKSPTKPSDIIGPISFTRITSRDTLSKRFFLNGGELKSDPSAQLTEGEVETVRASSLAELGRMLDTLESNQAITFGVTGYERADIRSEKGIKKYSGKGPVITRSNGCFKWPAGPGFMFLDIDARPGIPALDTDDVIAELRRAVPEFSVVTLLGGGSTSTHIWDAETGKQIKGRTGHHIQFTVTDARRIPEVGRLIEDRLWLAGHGWIFVTGAGAQLERSLVDAAVWQPSRLIFNKAKCVGRLEQRKPKRKIYAGEADDLVGRECPLNADDLVRLTDDEHALIVRLKADAREATREQAEETKKVWIEARLADHAAKNPKANHEEMEAARRRFFGATSTGVLPGDLELHLDDGSIITAAELAADPEKWHGTTMADPLEPAYGNGRNLAIAVLKGCDEPHIFSQAHGNQRFVFRTLEERHQEIAADFTASPPLPRKKAKIERLPVYSAADFASLLTPRDLIKGVLPFAETGMLYGESTAGKSFVALDMAFAIARGVEWRGQRVQQGQVLYVACEGAVGFSKRLKAYALHHAVNLESVPLYVVPDSPNFLNEKDIAAIIRRADETMSWLVIVDTLAQATPGANENSGEDMGQVIANCRRIHQETGAMVLLIHHAGKDTQKGARGWSGLRAAMDVELEVTRNGDLRSIKNRKAKDGVDGTEYPFRLQPVALGTDQDGDQITSCVIEHIDGLPETRRRQPTAKQMPVWNALRQMVELTGDGVPIAALIDKVAPELPHDPTKKDRRRERVMQFITGLVDGGFCKAQGGQLFLS